jgi:exopolysaccharide biosynthesis polyprenyl glycosylphosphotransferase
MPRSVSWLHVLADAVLIVVAFVLAWILRFASGVIPAPLGVIPFVQWLTLALLVLPLWILIAALHGLYYARLKQALSAEIGSMTHAAAEGLLATILLTFTIRGLPDSRLALLITIALGWLLMAGCRALLRRIQRSKPHAVVIGDSPLAEFLRRRFAGPGARFELAAAYSTAGDFEPVNCDVVFCDEVESSRLWEMLADELPQFALHLLPGGDTASLAALSVATIEGVPTLAVKSNTDLAMMRRIKRVIDIIGALLLLLVTSPLWLFCLIMIAITMPGPVFFSHERLGLFGKTFRLLKFRSMVRDAHKIDVDLATFDDKYKLKHDPRITMWGRVMRKLSLDELPQLLNILRGELSLVGPRPIVEDEMRKYGNWGRLLLTVPPGLTGLWQVSGRSDTSYQQRVDFDLYYINNWSLGLDLLILARTIPAVLSRRGAY